MKSKSTHRSPKERRPSIEALRALAILAETGSVSETARRLGVAQPVISKKLHIFKDAKVCGAILLRSNGAAIELTEAAQSALPAIQELVARYDRIMRFWHGEETESRVLRIGVGSFAAEYYLRRDSDAGIQLGQLAEDQVVPLKNLSEWELIGPDRQSGLRRQLEQRLRTKSLYFAVEGGGWSAAKQFALHDLGVAIVPRATITEADQKKMIHRRLSPDFDITDFLLYRSNESSDIVLQAKNAFARELQSNALASNEKRPRG